MIASLSQEKVRARARRYRSYAGRSFLGRSSARRISTACNAGSMTPATLIATWSCRSKMASSEPSKRSAQRCAPVSASISCAVMRTHPPARFAHRAFEHVAHTKLAPDLFHIDGLALVSEARIARDHEQPADAGKLGDDLLDHAVCEVFLVGIAAQILERQYRDRRLVGQWQTLGGRRRCFRGAGQAGQPIATARHRHDVAMTLPVAVQR